MGVLWCNCARGGSDENASCLQGELLVESHPYTCTGGEGDPSPGAPSLAL